MTAQEAIDVLFNEWKCIDRNDGIHCDRKCETCDLVMDVGIIREAFNMAISALQAQDSPKPTSESVQNVQNEDLISRKAAIDALHTWFRDGFDEDRWWNSTHVLAALEGLPSAQPEVLACGEGVLNAQPEIIECGDCKHRGEKPISDGRYWCDIHDAYMHYCSDAERRTDDADANT